MRLLNADPSRHAGVTLADGTRLEAVIADNGATYLDKGKRGRWRCVAFLSRDEALALAAALTAAANFQLESEES